MERYCRTIHRDPLCDTYQRLQLRENSCCTLESVPPMLMVKTHLMLFQGLKQTIHVIWVGHHFTNFTLHVLIAWKDASGDTRVWNWIKISHNFCISNCLFMLCWRREHDDPVVPGARIPGFWPFILRSEVRPGWQFPPPLQPSPSPGSATAGWFFDDTVPRWCIGAADFNIRYGRLQKHIKHKADPNLWPLINEW